MSALPADLYRDLFHPGRHVREELFQERVVRQGEDFGIFESDAAIFGSRASR